MTNTDMSVTQMQWQPALMCLTYVARPQLDGGVPTRCYVSPQNIIAIVRWRAEYDLPDGGKVTQCCTGVQLSPLGHWLHVLESPEEVAAMRDRAFGIERKHNMKEVLHG